MAFPPDPDDSYNLPPGAGEWTGETSAALIIERGDAKQTVRPILRPVYVIGGAADCDMVLGDSQFADYHAYVYLRNGIVTLRHLGSMPETTVNGRVIKWGELRHSDRIRFGPYQLQLRLRPTQSAPDQEKQPDKNEPQSTIVHDFRWDQATNPWMSDSKNDMASFFPKNRFTGKWGQG